jgi:hAT family C-terminal dimerisation region
VFILATSNAASERNFSTFGILHSKLRNCLTAEKVEELVYTKNKLPTFATDRPVCSVPDDDDGGDLNRSNNVSLLD